MSRLIARSVMIVSLLSMLLGGWATPAVVAQTPPQSIVIDADIGVDDAAAVAYLLSVPQEAAILGITTVAGNTTADNAANNALILLDVAKRTNIPVVVGAAAPLALPASHQGMLVHGPDGWWFTSTQFPPHDLSALSHDAPGFLCQKAQPGITLLALGPLTNVANAVAQCPDAMKQYKIVWLGGAKDVAGEGNTPVSVFNPWFDPDAAKQVLNAPGLSITMVATDAARDVKVDPDVFDRLSKRGSALGKLIAPALKQYASVVETTNRFGKARVALFDPSAAVLALHPELGTAQSALVDITVGVNGPTRGETVIALTVAERVMTIADDAELSALADAAFSDPNFDLQAAMFAILSRRPDNAQVVLTADAKQIKQLWLKALAR